MAHPLWDRIQEVYYSTLPMAPAERHAFVASACAGDPQLLNEVISLLQADESSGDFLESPLFETGLRIISSKEVARDSSTLDLIGTTIGGHYLVEKELGHGGMGKVYLARDLSLHNRPVVIKVLLQASLQNSYVVQKFQQEVEALARVDHPGVVSVLGANELPDGKPYIVMQYVRGLTLRSQIPSGGMDLERAASILKQIGEALDSVHEKGIFHRDLKPENIMLQPRKGGTELVKIVDFGIAKIKDSVIAPSTADNIQLGTALYMSPEQLRGGERITAASDVYSMAVIAYEMVTGRWPFNPTSAAQLLELHRQGVRIKPVDLRANVPSKAQAIILRGLAFQPGSRYQSALEFGDSLSRALETDDENARIDSEHSVGLGEGDTFKPDAGPTVPPNSGGLPVDNGRMQTGRNGFTVASVVVLVCAVVLLVLYLKQRSETTPGQGVASVATPGVSTSPSPSTRSITFWLTVQRMRNGKPYKNVFQSNGLETFATGDRFRFNLSSPEPAYVYVFNEGTPEPNRTSFTIIYPTRVTNDGSASIGANQVLKTNWNEFSGQPGNENFWIVWSTAPVSELEEAKSKAFEHPQGGLTGETLDAVKKFLMTQQVKVSLSRDKTAQTTTLRGAGDVLVKRVEFTHR